MEKNKNKNSKSQPRKENKDEILPPYPQYWKTFLIYAGIPLLLLILPGLVENIIRFDYAWAVGQIGTLLITGFGFIPSPESLHTPITPITESSSMQPKSKRVPEESKSKNSPQSPRNEQKDKFDLAIANQRLIVQQSPNDVFKMLRLADLLRHRDLSYHDGGTVQDEGIERYQSAIDMILKLRAKDVQEGKSTKELKVQGSELLKALQEHYNGDEFFLQEYTQKSWDGLLCSVYTSLSKIYFMANMFEDSVDAASKALEFKPNDLDALNSRGSSLMILGRYKEAAQDYTSIIQRDTHRYFIDSFNGLAKVLVADETVVENGWETIVNILQTKIPQTEQQMQSEQAELAPQFADQLKRMHLVMFQYHDSKTQDVDLAWYHLTQGLKYKMAYIQPFNKQMEKHRIQTTKNIFNPSLFPAMPRSDSKVPIFIIGFVRSGSTLLERILDAHPLIVGTGEDSVFNGRLPEIRDAIVKSSAEGVYEMQKMLVQLADFVADTMRDRWLKVQKEPPTQMPTRFVDKMLSNYMNVGFIHMVFPEALILHVAREPMDTIFSAFKHDFPSGHLDYLSEFESLAQIYDGYRQMIAHWDEVLPGRVTHVRYEDIVNDMPGVAKAIIQATGLKWEPDVLNFHKKRQAVNTLSTNQVRKGIYKDGIESWKKYETQLKPLVKLVGSNVRYPLKTSIPGYNPPL